jgi:multiple sugar transport system ATP-binding protein
MTVRQNIAFPLVSQGLARAEIAQRVAQAASTLRIGHLLNKSVSGLTSGDRQRVALGRAIVRQPLAFMMDEPLGALDAEFRELMCHELRALHDRLGATTVYVTHDQREAMAMADKIAIMNQGVIEQLGAPQEIYERPASVFVADFMGSPSMNFIPTQTALARGATSINLGPVTLELPAVCEAVGESPLLYGVRPEHIRLSASAPLRAEVVGVEYLGNCQIITLNTAQGSVLRAKVDVQVQALRGDQVGLEINCSEMTLFDQGSGRAIRTARDDRPLSAVGTRKAAHG